MNEYDPHSPDETFVDGGGIKRRTIMAGAAWTIPVIAATTAAPAYAASNELTLAFDQSSYDVKGCSTLSGVTVHAMMNGQPASGTSITVTLPSGYTFEDGSTSYIDTSGTDGTIALPGIKTPASSGSSAMSATASGANSTSATIDNSGATESRSHLVNTANGDDNTFDSVPVDATPLGGQIYQAPNGDIYNGNTRIVSGAKSGASPVWVQGSSPAQGYYIGYVDANGAAHLVNTADGTDNTFGGVPANATPLGGQMYQAQNGDLYNGNNRVASGAKAGASAIWVQGSSPLQGYYIGYIDANGAAHLVNTANGTDNTFASVPTNATPLGGQMYQAPNGDIYNGNTRVTTGAKLGANAVWVQGPNPSQGYYTGYVDANGVSHLVNTANGDDNTFSNVPADATPLGGQVYQAQNGDVYNGNTRMVRAANAGARLVWVDGSNPSQGYYIGYQASSPKSSC